MPYYIYRVKPFGQLDKLEEHGAFAAASSQAKTLRAALPPGSTVEHPRPQRGSRTHFAVLEAEVQTVVGAKNALDQFFGLEIEGRLSGQVAGLIEEAKDILVVLVTKRTQQGGDKELATTATTVEVDPEEVVLVELDFDPGAAVRDDAEGVEHLAARVSGLLETDARGAVKLGNDDTLGAVDDKGTTVGDHRDFAHQDFFVLEGALLTEAELEHHRDRVGRTFADALEFGLLGQHQAVLEVLETEVAVVALHREGFAEDGIEADVLAGGRGLVQLQKIVERENLVLDQVGRRDDFA